MLNSLNMTSNTDKTPTPDRAEDNAFFPSPFALSQFTGPKTDFDGASYPNAYKGGKWKVLVVATQERYLPLKNGKSFSTGNHPVETLLPMYHLHEAGFEIDIVTPSGDSAKLEYWAFPHEDEAVNKAFSLYKNKLKHPLSLPKIIDQITTPESPYLGVFVPGGHGALNEIPNNENVAKLLTWTLENDRYIISICHGPACLLAPTNSGLAKVSPFKGYEVCVFPDSLDSGTCIDIGYLPGEMPWLLGSTLEKDGVKLFNKDMGGYVHRDRKLITGDSPLAANKLGKLATTTLLDAVN